MTLMIRLAKGETKRERQGEGEGGRENKSPWKKRSACFLQHEGLTYMYFN